MKRILVSGASGIVGYGVLRSLRMSGMRLYLVGTSIYDDSVAPAFCDEFELAPKTSDASYGEWLENTIAKHGIDLVVPGIEVDMYDWVGRISAIERCGAKALINNPSLIQLCRDKWAFYLQLRQSLFPFVITSELRGDFEELSQRFGLPFLLKPRRGFASKGIVRVESKSTFLRHAAELGEILMAQPIVGSDEEEFTTSAFCDGKGGWFAHMTLRRKLSKDGFTEKAEVYHAPMFDECLSALCKRFCPLGPTNFQFRLCNDEVKLLEINPRISSSTSIRAAFGYNESAMSVEYFLEGKSPTQPVIRRGKAIRYTDEVIFYDNRIHI